MKILLILLIPVLGFAQKKGDNEIIIPYQNYNSIKMVLFQNGYSLENNDTTFLTTSSKELKKASVALKLIIFRGDTMTIIKGLIKPTFSFQLNSIKTESDFEPLVFKGVKKSPIRLAWEEMDKIAKLLSEVVIYKKEN